MTSCMIPIPVALKKVWSMTRVHLLGSDCCPRHGTPLSTGVWRHLGRNAQGPKQETNNNKVV